MARKTINRETKSQGGVMVVGEGITEWYYLQSIKDIISTKVNPDVSEHKDGIGYIEKKIKQCIDKGADTVICLIDMDNKQEEPNATKYNQLKAKCHNKMVSGIKSRNKARVEFYENFPCIELWFYYYFAYSTASVSSCKETINMMDTHWPDYKKTEAYFKSLPNGIHLHITNQLKGDFNAALSNSLKSTTNRDEQGCGAYSEMKELFDKILKEDYKKELSVYSKKTK